jgi:hypothetical protein
LEGIDMKKESGWFWIAVIVFLWRKQNQKKKEQK